MASYSVPEGTENLKRMGIIGEAWKKLSEAEHKKYEEMSNADAIRFSQQTEDLAKKGYFIMKDGTKSSDHVPKKKRK